MSDSGLLQQISKKESDKEEIAAGVIEKPELLAEIFEGLSSDKAAAKIALAKPELADRIAQELLKVEKASYQTNDCRNIALGHTIQSFGQFFDQITDKEPVIELIRRQLNNPRNATRRKAEAFAKQHKITTSY